MGERSGRGLDGTALKYIAMASMLLDHIGAVFLEYALYFQGGTIWAERMEMAGWGMVLTALCTWLRMAGRLAFPLYCLLLVEGFVHTRSRGRYLAGLLLFAMVSEVPFDLAFANKLWDPGSQNVFWELALGVVMLWGLEGMEGRRALEAGSGKGAGAAALAGAFVTAVIFQPDYGATGLFMMAVLYLCRGERRREALWTAVLGGLESWGIGRGFGALAAVPVLLYNGERGRMRHKYLFYVFYPAHLLVLAALRLAVLGIGPMA